MNIKNLKINKRAASLLAAGVILVTSLTGCKDEQIVKQEVYTTEDGLKDSAITGLIIDKNIIQLNQLKLMNRETQEIITKIDSIVVGNKIMQITDPIEVKFGKDIKAVNINNYQYSPSDFSLVREYNVNGTVAYEEVNNIDSVMYSDRIEDFDNSILADNNLTEANFNKLVEELYTKYVTEMGLAIEKEDLKKLVLVVNIDELAQTNPDFIANVVKESTVDEVMQDAHKAFGTLMNENNALLCLGNVDYTNYMHASDLIFNQDEKAKVLELEEKIGQIFLNFKKTDTYNELLREIIQDTEDQTNMLSTVEGGARYAFLYLGILPVRTANLMKMSSMNKFNAERIKYFVTFADDGAEYENNSMTTACYGHIYDNLTNCNAKKLTK